MRVLLTLFLAGCLQGIVEGIGAAEIYREIDDQGQPGFSDIASDKAEIIRLPDTQTFPGLKIPQHPLSEEAKGETRAEAKAKKDKPAYTELDITDPADGNVIRSNDGALNLTINISPALQAGHKAELVTRGKVLRRLAGSGQVTLTNLDRGQHEFNIQVTDDQGRLIDSGPLISITLLRISRLDG